MLNAPFQTQKDSVEGQGSGNPVKPRGLNRDKAKNPNETSLDVIRDKPALYARVITPQEIEVSRVIVQVTSSETRNPFSSQLNNKINPTMENITVKGGDRITI